MVRANPTGSTERPTMSPTRLTICALAVALASCGGQAPDPPSTTSPAAKLDGLYRAELDRRALAGMHLPAGAWTLLIDSKAHRLVLSHPNSGGFTERLTAVDD